MFQLNTIVKVSGCFFLLSCASPNPMSDAMLPSDASPVVDAAPADAALTTRPPVYPTRPAVQCTRWASNSLTVPPAMAAGCVPWVGFPTRHDRETALRYVAASACGQVTIVDPTMMAMPAPINWLPMEQTPVPGSITPIIWAQNLGDRSMLVGDMAVQLGDGLRRSQIQMGQFVALNDPRNRPIWYAPEPGARIVNAVGGTFTDSPTPNEGIVLVLENAVMQPDGSFEIQRQLRGNGFISPPRATLTPLRRRSGAPQLEGVTIKSISGAGFTFVTCAAADGQVVVDWYANQRLYSPVQYDTGDAEIQRCTIANINGVLVGIASSERRSVAFTVDLEPLPGATRPASAIRPFSLQPYFLPPDMAQLGTDQGPFDVAMFGGLEALQSGLVMYGRRPMGAPMITSSFGLFDRELAYDSRPTAVEFPDRTMAGELTAAAIWSNGQVAFARYKPSTGRLEAASAVCFR
jgi:hypothetical protein